MEKENDKGQLSYWTKEQVEEFDEMQKVVIPKKDEMLDIMKIILGCWALKIYFIFYLFQKIQSNLPSSLPHEHAQHECL